MRFSIVLASLSALGFVAANPLVARSDLYRRACDRTQGPGDCCATPAGTNCCQENYLCNTSGQGAQVCVRRISKGCTTTADCKTLGDVCIGTGDNSYCGRARFNGTTPEASTATCQTVSKYDAILSSFSNCPAVDTVIVVAATTSFGNPTGNSTTFTADSTIPYLQCQYAGANSQTVIAGQCVYTADGSVVTAQSATSCPATNPETPSVTYNANKAAGYGCQTQCPATVNNKALSARQALYNSPAIPNQSVISCAYGPNQGTTCYYDAVNGTLYTGASSSACSGTKAKQASVINHCWLPVPASQTASA